MKHLISLGLLSISLGLSVGACAELDDPSHDERVDLASPTGAPQEVIDLTDLGPDTMLLVRRSAEICIDVDDDGDGVADRQWCCTLDPVNGPRCDS